MTIPHLPHRRYANDAQTFAAHSQSQRASNNAPRRANPLMRRIEVASLSSDFSIQEKTHIVPQSELFERAVSGFARGTILTTPEGPIAIEDLLPGDMVATSQGPQRVLWIGSTMIIPGQTPGGGVLTGLIRVTAEAFGRARPAVDLVLGPAATILHNPPQFRAANGEGHVLTPLSDFIDGVSVFPVTPPSAVKVFHLMLRRHCAVETGGMQIESFHPGNTAIARMGENAQALFMSLFPDMSHPRDFGPVCFPRVELETLEGLRVR